MLRGRSVLPLVVEKQRAEFAQMCEAAFQGEPGMLQFEIVGLKGRRLWMETRIAPLRNSAGQVTAILGVTSDITDRRRADEQLRDSEQRLTQAAGYRRPRLLRTRSRRRRGVLVARRARHLRRQRHPADHARDGRGDDAIPTIAIGR